MAGRPPPNDPAAQAAASAAAAVAAAAAAGGGAGAGGGLPGGVLPPPLPAMPVASPGPVSKAIWAKRPEAERASFSTSEMRTCSQVLQGNNPDPGDLVLSVTTGSVEPECFLASRTNSANARPKIKLIHSVGARVVALGQPDDLHGQTFAFVQASKLATNCRRPFSSPTMGERCWHSSRPASGRFTDWPLQCLALDARSAGCLIVWRQHGTLCCFFVRHTNDGFHGAFANGCY